MPDLTALQESLGVTFHDQALLQQALVHSSYLNENPGLTPGPNERLEFLGDAVLGLLVAERLYQDFPRYDEGELTRLRAALVRRETLAAMARALDLGGFLYLGRGEEASGGRAKTANLAGALEAVIAAVFLDQGLPAARALVLRLVELELERARHRGAADDFKSRLQETIQTKGQPAPTYHAVEETGPDHDRVFTVEVRAGARVLGEGTGHSKKAAETEAARDALERLSGGTAAPD